MILVTGSNGQLGQCLANCMDKGNTIFADKQTLDITDRNAVLNFVRDNNIDTIVNCAAYTAVDKAESEPELARKINVDGPLNLASTGAKLIHVSTDYVFDGKATFHTHQRIKPIPYPYMEKQSETEKLRSKHPPKFMQ